VSLDRAALFAGRRAVIEAPESLALCGLARSCLSAAFGVDDPRGMERRLDPDAWFDRVRHARRLLGAADWATPLRALLPRLGFDAARTAFDVPRLRAVSSRMHAVAGAEPAFFAHRDTWYANPSAQVNVWLPLFDVTPAETFVVYPAVFATPVRNDSRRFELASFERDAGFQGRPMGSGAIYPRALDPVEWGDPEPVAPALGQAFVFSAAHLHATRAHDVGRSRFSLDFRCIDLDDVAEGRGAPDVDDASSGDTLAHATRPAAW